MEAFITRRKRKSSPQLAPQPTPKNPENADLDADEPTDVKLAMLSSLHPGVDQETLLDLLLAHDGSVQVTSEALRETWRSVKRASSGGVVAQTSLRSFAIDSEAGSLGEGPSKKARLLSKKGTTLHLYDPKDISEHTPCTIIHNFLPQDEANQLLVELLEESKTFEKITFKLFDNVVSSPHTSSFYVGSYDELNQQMNEYVYNGARLTVRVPWFWDRACEVK